MGVHFFFFFDSSLSFTFCIQPLVNTTFYISRIQHLIVSTAAVIQSLSRVWLFVTPQTVARQAPLSVGFPRQG